MPYGTDAQRLKAPAAWCQALQALEGAAWEAKVVRSRLSLHFKAFQRDMKRNGDEIILIKSFQMYI